MCAVTTERNLVVLSASEIFVLTSKFATLGRYGEACQAWVRDGGSAAEKLFHKCRYDLSDT